MAWSQAARVEEVMVGVLSFHDVAKAALRAVNFENKLLKQYIRDWPEGDKAS